MQEVTVASPTGAELAVADHGGEGRAVVLVHGLGSNLRVWDAVAPLLTDGYRVVAYDQRGHGLSSDSGGDFGHETLVQDLEAVIEHLGLDDPFVVGHSWGAAVAIAHAALRDGCPGIVGVDGGVVDLQDIGLPWDLCEQILRPPDLEGLEETLISRIRSEQSALPWDTLEPIVRRSFRVGPDGIMRRRTPVADHMAIIRLMWEARVGEAYDRIRCPAMCVLAHGYITDERVAAGVAAKQECARRLSERHPEVRIEWVESTHDVPVHKPGELVHLLRSFLDPLSPRTPA